MFPLNSRHLSVAKEEWESTGGKGHSAKLIENRPNGVPESFKISCCLGGYLIKPPKTRSGGGVEI